MKPVSLKIYALILGLITISIFSGFVLFTHYQIKIAQQTLSEWKVETSKEEIQEAINEVSQQGQKYIQHFAQWEEVRQQLSNPSFYVYWRNQRLINSDFLPQDKISAHIYSASGDSLMNIPTDDLPKKISQQQISYPNIINKNQTTYAIFSAAVYNPTDKSLMGYVAISLPFLERIKNQRFNYVDNESLQIKSTLSFLTFDNVIDALSYSEKTNIATITVKTILTNSAQSLFIASIVISILLYVLLIYGVRQPLQQLIDFIHLLKKQPDLINTGHSLKSLFVKELNSVATALNEYQYELNKVYGSLDEKNSELLHMAYTDVLTGSKNRRAFNDHWQQICSVAESSRLDICMLLFDINHFKGINDSYGHQVGDEVLIHVAKIINAQIRKGEQLYRLGGDEFCTVMINCNNDSGYDIAKRCQNQLETYDFNKLCGIHENVRISIGIASTQSNNQADLDNLSWQADAAVYLAKRPDNFDIVTFKPEMTESSKSLFSNWMYAAIFDAIEKGQGIQIHYQPIVALDNQKTCYYEALVRITHHNEMLPPSHIFPIITARDLDKEMDQAIVKAICHDIENNLIAEGSGVSINLSGPSISSDDLMDWLEPICHYLPRYKIIFEVTETVLITQMSKAADNLNQLKAKGFLIALDDFGSGYSSVRYLGSMPVDIVKFDMSLIVDLYKPKQRTLIHSLCHMMKDIGYQMVAEGIEEQELLEKVIEAGFDYGQGYLFGRPKCLTKKD
jgi:diguanylate cyclase (GGDEF)-like protein